jgi:hypothetical protein
MLVALAIGGGVLLLWQRARALERRDAAVIAALIDHNRARARPGMAARDALLMAQAETRARARRPVD